MSFGFPAYYESSETYYVEAYELHKMIENALAEFDWHLETDRFSNITAFVPLNWMSWGEKLTISFNESGTLTARSECRMPTQCFDWGKNRQNVVQFLSKLRLLEKFANAKLPAASPGDGISPLTKLINENEEN